MYDVNLKGSQKARRIAQRLARALAHRAAIANRASARFRRLDYRQRRAAAEAASRDDRRDLLRRLTLGRALIFAAANGHGDLLERAAALALLHVHAPTDRARLQPDHVAAVVVSAPADATTAADRLQRERARTRLADLVGTVTLAGDEDRAAREHAQLYDDALQMLRRVLTRDEHHRLFFPAHDAARQVDAAGDR